MSTAKAEGLEHKEGEGVLKSDILFQEKSGKWGQVDTAQDQVNRGIS